MVPSARATCQIDAILGRGQAAKSSKIWNRRTLFIVAHVIWVLIIRIPVEIAVLAVDVPVQLVRAWQLSLKKQVSHLCKKALCKKG